MPAPGLRGFAVANYITDDGQMFSLLVDRAYVGDPDRGWQDQPDLDVPRLPRGWLPRRVVGIDPDGIQQTTRVANTTCPLWTGASTTFAVEASDGSVVDATVTNRQEEIQPGAFPPSGR